MKIVIYEPNGELQHFLTDYMIKNRLEPIIVDKISAIYSLLLSKEYDIFLTDYSTKTNEINDIIFNLKLDAELDFIKIFITTPKPQKDVLQTMIKLGINGFIKKPFNLEQFNDVFSKWLKTSSFRNSKRVHARVEPVPTDNAFLYLKTEFHNRDIPCEIINISAGGVAVELPRSFIRFLNTSIKTGTVLKKTLLRIRQAALRVDAEVMMIIDNRLNLKFVNTDDESMRYIYHYLADNFGG